MPLLSPTFPHFFRLLCSSSLSFFVSTLVFLYLLQLAVMHSFFQRLGNTYPMALHFPILENTIFWEKCLHLWQQLLPTLFLQGQTEKNHQNQDCFWPLGAPLHFCELPFCPPFLSWSLLLWLWFTPRSELLPPSYKWALGFRKVKAFLGGT